MPTWAELERQGAFGTHETRNMLKLIQDGARSKALIERRGEGQYLSITSVPLLYIVCRCFRAIFRMTFEDGLRDEKKLSGYNSNRLSLLRNWLSSSA